MSNFGKIDVDKLRDSVTEEFNKGKYSRDNISEEELNEAYAKGKNLGDLFEIFKDLIGMVADAVKGNYKIDKVSLAFLIGVIIYVISPIDLIPDAIPIVGWIDDSALVGFAVKKYADIINDWKRWKREQKDI
jgi:uncharacterized membrane protein YkvA (DUF1232 family)